jgi:hypothetical protein
MVAEVTWRLCCSLPFDEDSVPRIVRPMYVDPADGLPLVGSHKRCLLGVRPMGKSADIDLTPAGDVNGNVAVNRKGLSVSADWRQLPPYMIPEELDDEVNGASGIGMKVYVHGTGVFVEGAVAPGLEMRFKLNTVDAGVVSPVAQVTLVQYQADLEATRAQWVEDPS